MSDLSGARIHITGIVQGVGFRPFVYGLATRLALTGWVRNTSAGVDIEVDGPGEAVQAFVQALQAEAPPLARLDSFEVASKPPDGFSRFEIVHSEAIEAAFQPISPDVCICADCLRELFDPQDRRYHYPFINCTNCGPRFTIIEDIPYDRPKTTMALFELCPDCAGEYQDPLDRRFHAQPVACPVCGPQVWMERLGVHPQDVSLRDIPGAPDPGGSGNALQEAQRLLLAGQILAIKGLGGFHLACDATNPQTVAELRRRKLRIDKPFALMMPNLTTVEAHCYLSPDERDLLVSRARPVVILDRRPESSIAAEVAPNQDTLGVMLPYTPLHYLLFNPFQEDTPVGIHSEKDLLPLALVMTSGNLSEEPIAFDNQEARQRLAPLADAFLMHNRPIRTRCDDSVARLYRTTGQAKKATFILRRARGYAPDPLQLPWDSPPLLATGAELKNTFCLTRDRYAFLSHHIGDLENYETLQSFEDGVAHLERLFRIQPRALAYDLHPDYLATRYALRRAETESLPAFRVQHHHAHIAACLADHGLSVDRPVIGVSFDGTGYGQDGAIWGGEFLVADYRGYRRYAHLDYYPLPGGDAATRKPARIALAYLWQAGLDWDPDLASYQALCVEERQALRAQLENQINTPPTSSIGRLFDAVAALAGVRQEVNYEAQAAIELEALVEPQEIEAYPFEILPLQGQSPPAGSAADDPSLYRIELGPLLAAILLDLQKEQPLGTIAARFHRGLAQMVCQVCMLIRRETGLNRVALSGGVWQNRVLLHNSCQLLGVAGFEVLVHARVPTNDGGLALGQAAIAAHQPGI